MADQTIPNLSEASTPFGGDEMFEASQDGGSVKVLFSDHVLYVQSVICGVGAGSPEGAVTATAGAHYWQTDVGDWVKNSGSGNTGWVQHTSIV